MAAQAHGLEAIAVLVEIMKDKKAPHATRVAASNSILDRGYGKPSDVRQVTGEGGGPIKATIEADEELRALLGRLADQGADKR